MKSTRLVIGLALMVSLALDRDEEGRSRQWLPSVQGFSASSSSSSSFASVISPSASASSIVRSPYRQQQHRQTSRLTLWSLWNPNNNDNSDFSYQEMMIILAALRKSQRVRPQDINVETAQALVAYIQQVAVMQSNRQGSSDTTSGRLGTDTSVWTLAFTTDASLPRDTTVQITFLPSPPQSSITITEPSNKLLYSLVFGERTVGLNRIDVTCVYRMQQQQPLPILQYTYDSVSMDAFGYKAIDLCFAAWLLKGRSNRIQTAYLDESVWIERVLPFDTDDTTGNPTADSSGWNVFLRETKVNGIVPVDR